MQRVLILGKVWPEPTSSAAGSRTMQLIELFANNNWEVHFASAAAASEHTANLDALSVKKHFTEINSSLFDAQLKTIAPAVVIFDRFTTEEQFGWRVAQHCPGALQVLDTIDLHCLRQARQAAVKAGKVFNTTDLLQSDVAKREVASIYRCDVSLMVSEVEIDLLTQLLGVPHTLLYYLPLFFSQKEMDAAKSEQGFDARTHFVSIGNFLHEPNWDSVIWLKQSIWPLIRRALPQAELHVYGAYASQKVQALHAVKDGFLIKGRASSAGEVMTRARVCLAPLRFGAGIKGKLLDAMLYGTPSVTTSVGAEGMHGLLPWNGAVEDEPERLAEAAVGLYSSEEKWELACKHGAAILEQIFLDSRHTAGFLKHLAALHGNLDKHRLQNFTGSLLRQQGFAATRYMALWIEAKNRQL